MVEPDIDRYGRYARESALADFLEIAALAGHKMSREALADYIVDNGWVGRGQELVHGPDPTIDVSRIWMSDSDLIEDEEEGGDVLARAVFELLRERELTLGVPRYPFTVDNPAGLTPQATIANAYGFLLCASVAHAWALDTTDDPKLLLEGFVCRALQHFGYLVANPGDWRRAGNFDQRLSEAGRALHLAPTPDAAYRARFAQDEGVDVVGHLWLNDLRPGRWVVIGQVTCATSDEWTSKFREPGISQWGKLLGLIHEPSRFLALPYHVPSAQFELETERGEGVLLDRLRLAHTSVVLTAAEQQLVNEVTDEEVVAA